MVTYAIEALGLAERFVRGDRVVVMLADNVFGGPLRPFVENFDRQDRGARILLAHLEEEEHLRHLGVAVMGGERRGGGDAGESIDAYYAVNDHVRANGANRT